MSFVPGFPLFSFRKERLNCSSLEKRQNLFLRNLIFLVKKIDLMVSLFLFKLGVGTAQPYGF